MAPSVEVWSGIADPVAFACRLLRKVAQSGARATVAADTARLARLDGELWSFEAQAFVAHARVPAAAIPPDRVRRTPIWLASEPALAPGATLLVNLGPQLAPGWDRFERVIDLVGQDPGDAAAGRRRWQAYAAAGHVPVHKPLAGEAG